MVPKQVCIGIDLQLHALKDWRADNWQTAHSPTVPQGGTEVRR